jgi:hypothetical protein
MTSGFITVQSWLAELGCQHKKLKLQMSCDSSGQKLSSADACDHLESAF